MGRTVGAPWDIGATATSRAVRQVPDGGRSAGHVEQDRRLGEPVNVVAVEPPDLPSLFDFVNPPQESPEEDPLLQPRQMRSQAEVRAAAAE